MTKLEKAKNTPAFSPQPSAVAAVSGIRSPSIVLAPQAAAAGPLQTPVAAVSRA